MTPNESIDAMDEAINEHADVRAELALIGDLLQQNRELAFEPGSTEVLGRLISRLARAA